MRSKLHSWISLLICAILFFALLITMFVWHAQTTKALTEIKNQINSANVSNVTTDLNFLTTEIQNYRDFIETQQERLIWLFGLLGAAALAILGAFGFKSKSDVEAFLHRRYEEEMKDQFERKLAEITGTRNMTYLQNAVRREQDAGKKMILFAYVEENDKSTLTALKERLPQAIQDHTVIQKIQLERTLDYREAQTYLDRITATDPKDIVVLCHGSAGNTADNTRKESEKHIYQNISRYFNENRRNLILFGKYFSIAPSSQYCTTVNYLSKCLETLNTILYYM